jgi:ribose-phosphate pyrophosphokinase
MKSVVVGQAGLPLVSALAQRLEGDLVSVGFNQFSDTECYLKFHPEVSLAQATVFVVFQFSRGIKTGDCMESRLDAGSLNDQLLGLFSLLHLLSQQNAAAVHLVLPYMPYSRQELSFDGGYQGSVYMLGRCLKALGVQSVFLCDIHEPSMRNNFPVKLHSIPMTDLWVSVFQSSILGQRGAGEWCVLSPDEGGRDRAAALAKVLDLPTAFMRKTRVDVDQPLVRELVGTVHGKHVLMIDDIVDTARTAQSACDLLKKQGALNVVSCNTHAIVGAEAYQRLLNSGCEHVFVSDTLINENAQPHERLSVVEVSDFIVERIVGTISK